MQRVIMMFIALRDHYQHRHFHFGIHFVFGLWAWLAVYHTLLCCIISIHWETSGLLMALCWVSKLYLGFCYLFIFFNFFYQRTTRLERKENRHGFVPRHLSKTPLMRENMWELWKIMQIRIRWCSRGLAVSFHPFYLKSGSRGVH